MKHPLARWVAQRKIPWFALSTVSLAVLMMPLSYLLDYDHKLIAALLIGK